MNPLRSSAIVLMGLLANSAGAVVPPIPPVIVLPTPPNETTDPTEDETDLAKLADRIGKSAKTVSDKLSDRDTGDRTLKDQKNLKQDLDRLIDLLQNQPPPPMSNDSSQVPPPPSGGGKSGQPPQPMAGQQPKGGQQPMGGKRRSGSGQRQPMPMGGQPMPMGGQPMPMGGQPMPMGGQPMPMGGQPMPMGGQPMPMGSTNPGTNGQSTQTLPLAETIAKDFWGHLPEQPRQRMMQFFREQYNSRYKDLLPDYFSTLAEKEKKGKK